MNILLSCLLAYPSTQIERRQDQVKCRLKGFRLIEKQVLGRSYCKQQKSYNYRPLYSDTD